MYVSKTEIEIWTNHTIQGEKKTTQSKIGTISLEWYADLEDINATISAIDENLFKHDAVQYRIKLTADNC
jgi:hypothetical protein